MAAARLNWHRFKRLTVAKHLGLHCQRIGGHVDSCWRKPHEAACLDHTVTAAADGRYDNEDRGEWWGAIHGKFVREAEVHGSDETSRASIQPLRSESRRYCGHSESSDLRDSRCCQFSM